MSDVVTVFNNPSYAPGSSLVASATGLDGYAGALISGGVTTGDSIEAIATSATTQATIKLEDTVNGGSIFADGNAQIYIDGAKISGATLRTIGVNAAIGVFGGGSATVTSATISKGSFIYDDGVLVLSGGSAGPGVTFESFGPFGNLTLSGLTFGAADRLLAAGSGTLTVSAGGAGSTTFAAGTIVQITSGGIIEVDGGVTNSGTIEGIMSGLDNPGTASVVISAGSAGVTNVKGGLIAAESSVGNDDTAEALVAAGSAFSNFGAMVAVANGGTAGVGIEGTGTVTNFKGAVISTFATEDGFAALAMVGDSISNSGVVEAVASKGSEVTFTVATFTGGLTNTSAIELTATQSSSVFELLSLAGPLTNNGTFELITSAESKANVVGAEASSLDNTKTMLAKATGNSSASLPALFDSGVINAGIYEVVAAADSRVTGSLIAGGTISNTNTGTLAAIATGDSDAILSIAAGTVSNGSTINKHIIEASAATGGSALVTLSGAIDNAGGTLLATESGGIAAIDLGNGAAVVSGGFLKSIGSNAAIGVLGLGGAAVGSAADVDIVSGSRVVGWGGTLTLSDIVGAIGAGTLVQAANDGVVLISGPFVNSGTVEAITNSQGTGDVGVEAGGSVTNAKGGLIEVKNSAGNGASAQVVINGASAFNNFGTIAAESDAISGDAAAGDVMFTSVGTFTNFKGAVISAFATQDNLGGVIIDNNGSIFNSGIMAVSASEDASGVLNLTTGSGGLTNTGTVEQIATQSSSLDGTINVDGLLTNNGTIENIVSAESEGTFVEFSAGSLVNNKTILVKATGGSIASLPVNVVSGAVNAGTFEVQAATGGLADESLLVSAGTFSNTSTGTLAAIATGDSTAEWSIAALAGDITNDNIIEASASSGSIALVDVLTASSGNIVNSKLMEATVKGGSGAALFIQAGGSTINTGTIAASAISGGTANIRLGGQLINSGTLVASASAWGDADLSLSGSNGLPAIGAARVTNEKGALIAAIASADGNAVAHMSGGINSGTIEAIAGSDGVAEVFLSGVVSNTGGSIFATGAGVGQSTIDIDGATISGGTLRTSGYAARIVVDGSATGTIDGATIAAHSDVIAYGTISIADTVIGSGATVKATDGGSVVVSGTIANSGALVAGDVLGSGTVTVTSGASVGGSSITIGDLGTVNVASGGTAGVYFQGDLGTLILADDAAKTSASDVTVSGFGGIGGAFPKEYIELTNVTSSASVSATWSNDVLTVTSNSTTVAKIDLVGNYGNEHFTISAGPGHDVLISDPIGGGVATAAVSTPATLASTANPPPSLINNAGASNVALLGSYMASLFASTEGGVTPASGEGAPSQTLIARPHTG